MWPFTPHQLAPDRDELEAMIEEGTAARETLLSACFLRVVDDLTNLHVSQMLAAPVGAAGVPERERNHALHQALSEIVSELKARAEAGAAAAEALNEDPNDD